MKIVVIGGNGLIGSRVTALLKEHGHEAIAASRSTGVNTLTGEGLAEALNGASVVVDVSNSPSFEDAAVLEFFQTSTSNLLAAEAAAGVGHHVALSVVGIERLPENGYFRAKVAQEALIKASQIPYSIIRATQFFEFVMGIAAEATDASGTTIRVSPALIQPMAADDVANAVFRTAIGTPLNGTMETAGPHQFQLDELIRIGLRARNDPREVVTDPQARYFGAELAERSLVPDGQAHIGGIHFEEWLNPSPPALPEEDPLLVAVETVLIEPPALKENEFHVSDVPPGAALLLGDVTVFNVEGSFCATQSKCTHRGGPLSKGKVDGSTVTCPMHGAQFNVCTGAVVRGPATVALKVHRVVVEDGVGRVEVAVLI